MNATCYLCNSDRCSFISKIGGFPVLECHHCGLRFLHPQPDDAVLHGIYDEEYFLGNSVVLQGSGQELKRLTARLYLEALWENKNHDGEKLLEIGCGMGDFLLEAKDRGLDVWGIEISEHTARIANQRLQSERVVSGILEDVVFPKNTFDIIVFFDVIEHVRDPLRFFQLVYKYLKSRGTVHVVTPSLESWSARLMGRLWMEYKVEHLFYFNKKSVERLMINSGFTRTVFLPNYKVLNLEYITQHFIRYPVPLVTPCLRVLRRITPDRMALRPFRIIASGMAVLGEKP